MFLVLDYEIQRCTRRCEKTDRELKPGETFYSTLVVEGADVVRHDYGEEAWQSAPENVLSWWKSRIPDPRAHTLHWAPNDAMLHYFEQLEGQPGKEETRYILALLLIRRRIVRLEETETDENGRETMILYCPRNETQYRATVDVPQTQRIKAIQEELAQLLFADAT